MSDFVGQRRGFFYCAPPYIQPTVKVSTSEQAAFPVINLFDINHPARGWHSTDDVQQTIGMDFTGIGVAAVLLDYLNMPVVDWLEAKDSVFSAYGAEGPNLLRNSYKFRTSVGGGDVQAPWASTTSGHSHSVPTDYPAGTTPYPEWTAISRTLPANTTTIYQTVTLALAPAAGTTFGFRVWCRSTPGAPPGLTFSMSIVNATGSGSKVVTTGRSWDAETLLVSLSHASNTTVMFQLQLNTSQKIDFANTQAWKTTVNRAPLCDYRTESNGYEVPINPETGRRSLLLELDNRRYQALRIPASQATDDLALFYSVGRLVGMTEWKAFPGPRSYNIGRTMSQPALVTDFPSGAKEFLQLGNRRLSLDYDLGDLLALQVRNAISELMGVGPGKAMVLWENLPPPDALYNFTDGGVAWSGFKTTAIRPPGHPSQAHVVRRTGDLQIKHGGLVELLTMPLPFEEVV